MVVNYVVKLGIFLTKQQLSRNLTDNSRWKGEIFSRCGITISSAGPLSIQSIEEFDNVQASAGPQDERRMLRNASVEAEPKGNHDHGFGWTLRNQFSE